MQSPYQFESIAGRKARVIIRAFDRAGNVQEGTLDVAVPFSFMIFAQNHFIIILEGILLLALLMLIFHYLFGHRILRHLRLAMSELRREDALVEAEEEKAEEKRLKEMDDPSPPNKA